MLEALAFLLVAGGGVAAVLRGMMGWYVAIPLVWLVWNIACQILWRRRRRRTLAKEQHAEAEIRTRTGAPDIVVDTGQGLFLAIDRRGGRFLAGGLSGGRVSSWPLTDFAETQVVVDKGFGIWFNRERTPAWRVIATLYIVLLPVLIPLWIISIFTGDGHSDLPDMETKRVQAIRLILTRTTRATIDFRVYDERGSIRYPKVTKAREETARAFASKLSGAMAAVRAAASTP